MAKLRRLFEPVKIGKLELRNRILMPALNTKLGTEWGAMSDRMIDYYVERAKGGVALIIIENTCIDWPVGKAGTNPIRADEWKFIQGLHDLAEAVHVYGAKIATQLHHAGRQGSSLTSAEGQQLVAPSAIPCLPTGAEMPHALTIEEIEILIGKFIMGATITKAAGFDAVEIQGGHGYLIAQFMSPYTNKREDEYGGGFEGRMRFPLRIIEGIRMVTGPDFPIIFRISADEYVDGGLTLEDNKLIAQRLELAGVDAFNVSAGIYESPPWFSRIFPTMGMPQGCNVPLAQEIKKVVRAPVIVAGKLGDPVLAEKVLKEGKADLIAMGRPLLVDPELPLKASQGRLQDIRPCIYCNEACAGNVSRMWRIGCVVNPALGREKEYQFEPARKAKRVLVVGGGPAGMEAARIASLRGHSVTLVEQQKVLGGQLLAASAPQFKQPIRDFMEYLKTQVKKQGVKVQLGKRVTPALVKRLKPDIVLIATGATPFIPNIPGADRGNVATASDILVGRKKAGKEVAIIGGGEVGAELAWHLAEQGKKVTVIEMLGAVAMDMNMFSRLYLMDKLGELGVNLLNDTTAQKITSEGVLALFGEGKEQLIKADTVILAAGFKCDNALEKGLKGISYKTYCIGDCVKPGKIEGAISSAWRVGHQI
jgi:2,4-dienoyl-CoA reductase-like NADH-dependent reductase (Old Yellow Enzyme family)/NADPH-dependent 2,4-dienoyl-CoA reductase/sulfur reductase-like enzyme